MPSPDEADQTGATREALDWLSRISLGDLTQEDLTALRRWRDASPAHAAALKRAGDLWRALEVPVARSASADAARGRAGVSPGRRAFIAGGAVAAAAAAVAAVALIRPPLGLWPSLNELQADYRTGTGEQQRVTLAETVSVELNTRTSIMVRRDAPDPTIELISGETAIAIARAVPAPFAVIAADGRASSRHGSFNIRRRENVVDVVCIDGETSVECGGRAATLQTGQRIVYGHNGLSDIGGADLVTITAWREGMLIFRNTPLATVIDEVNRYWPGRIILVNTSLGEKMVTARFEIRRLDTVMAQISQVFKVPVKSFPGGLVLVG